MTNEYISREAALNLFACDLGKKDYAVSYQGFMTEAAFRINDIPAADVVPGSDFRDCRNELCLRCGQYKTAHLGSCDGCRWRH